MYQYPQNRSCATTGIQSVTVSGRQFGQVQYSGSVRVGKSACQSSLWVSESSIRCRGMAGAAFLVGGFVSVAMATSPSVSSLFSYSMHAVASARVLAPGGGSGSGEIAASGGQFARVLGSGYSSVGGSQSARLRGSSCAMSVWLSDSDLRCRTAWGKDLSSYSKAVGVSVTQQQSRVTNSISYANVVPSASSVDRVPMTGGGIVSVSGLNVGSFGASARLQLQGTAFASSSWISSSLIVGKCSHGYGSNLGIAISVGTNHAIKPSIINHQSPIPTALKPTTGPGRGGLVVTLFGNYFGSALSATPSQMQVGLGGTDCTPSLAWTSDSAVSFVHPPGILPGLAVDIATDPLLYGNLQNAFGFAKPILTAIAPALQPTAGKSDITFFGSSFGGNPHDLARLKIGSTPCFLTTWLSDSSARCRIPPGVSNRLSTTYSIGNYMSVLTHATTYVSPAVGSVRPSYGNTRGGNFISVAGSNFGHGFYQQTIQVGASMCQALQFISDSSLRCTVLPGPGEFLDVVVSVAGQRGVLANSYSYYSADDNALNESPLSLSQEKYNQLLGFSISATILAFALAIGCAKIYSRARRRFALVVPAQVDGPGQSAPSFWRWLWRDMTSKEMQPEDAAREKSLKPSQPNQADQHFRRTTKKGYVQRAALTIDNLPPTPQAVAAALEGSEYFRAIARDELARQETLAQNARDEVEGLGLRVPSALLRAPQELPPSHGRRQRSARGLLPQAPALPRPY